MSPSPSGSQCRSRPCRSRRSRRCCRPGRCSPPVTVTEPVPSKASVGRERRRPGDAAVAARQRADSVPPTTVSVGVGEARHRLAEGERHQRAVVGVVQRSIDDVDRRRRIRVSIATVSVAPVAPMLPTSVGVDPGHRHRAGAVEAVVGRERRRPGDVVRRSSSSADSVPPATVDVGVGEARSPPR